MGGRSMKDVGGAGLAGSTPPFLGRERAAVNVDVGPERRSPRYHETYLALESVEESSACFWAAVERFFLILCEVRKRELSGRRRRTEPSLPRR